MQIRLSFSCGLLLLFLFGACVNTERKELVELVGFGIYSSNRDSPELLTMTNEIPATVGTVFGITVSLSGGCTSDYDFRWTFPEMRNPANGQVWTEMTGTEEVKNDGPQSFLVRINNDWEAKAGDWTIQLIQAGRVTTEKSFNVYDPAEN